MDLRANEIKIEKIDEDERIVFGFFSVVEKDGEPVVDREGDVIAPEDLEKAVYEFVLKSRVAGENHLKKGVGQLIESIVLTKEKQAALGIDIGKVAWWGGFKIFDDDVWKAVKEKQYLAFSIGGTAERADHA